MEMTEDKSEFMKYLEDWARDHKNLIIGYWGDYPNGSWSIIAWNTSGDHSNFGTNFWITTDPKDEHV